MMDINKNNQAGCDAGCQSKNIYQGKQFVFKQVAPRDLNVVFDHVSAVG